MRWTEDLRLRVSIDSNQGADNGTNVAELVAPGLDLDDARPQVGSSIDDHANAIGRHGGEAKARPDVIIAGDTAAGHVNPRRAGPVLHVEVDDAVVREGHSGRGIDRIQVVVL